MAMAVTRVLRENRLDCFHHCNNGLPAHGVDGHLTAKTVRLLDHAAHLLKLGGGGAHEFNNLSGGISGCTHEILETETDPERREKRMSDQPENRKIETGTDDLLARIENQVAILTMNRPKRRNAMSGPMLSALRKTLADAERDPDVRCVVLTGAGGAFCAGGDVKGMAESQGGGQRRRTLDEAIHLQRLDQRGTAGKLFEMPKPTIAMLPGAAAGAGLSLALACDLRIASDTAVMTTAFANVGFGGDYGGTFFMTHLIGTAKTRELYFLPDKIDAARARELGLVNRVVPADALEQETLAIASRLAQGPSIAYRYMKENINRAAMGGSMGECLDLEATHHVHTGLTEDHRNAVQAFVAKRQPEFKGR